MHFTKFGLLTTTTGDNIQCIISSRETVPYTIALPISLGGRFSVSMSITSIKQTADVAICLYGQGILNDNVACCSSGDDGSSPRILRSDRKIQALTDSELADTVFNKVLQMSKDGMQLMMQDFYVVDTGFIGSLLSRYGI